MEQDADSERLLDGVNAYEEHRKSGKSRAAPAPLKKWKLLAYGGLGMPLSLAEIPILLYLPAFYAQELHLGAGLVGLTFLLARLWDGLSDVLIGWLSDRTRSRWGRRKPWVLIGAPLLMISTWFLCNPPHGAGLVYLVVWAALFYTADTVVKIPYLTWGTELATDYVERSRVTAFRETFFMLGSLLFVTAPLIFLPADAPLSAVLLLVTFSVLVLVPLTIVPLGVWVSDSSRVTHAETHILKGLASMAKNRVLVSFSVAILLYAIANGVANSLAVFSLSVGLGLKDKLSWIIFILYVSTLCAVPITMRLAKQAEKHRLLAGAIAVLLGAYSGLLLLPAGNFPLVAALWIVAGIGNAAVLILPTSILADIIDHGELTAGARQSGAYMAIYNLIKKIGLALGVGLSFGLLDLVGYEPGATRHSAADARNVLLLGFGLPCLLFIPAILLIWMHPITRKVQRQLRERIDSRPDGCAVEAS